MLLTLSWHLLPGGPNQHINQVQGKANRPYGSWGPIYGRKHETLAGWKEGRLLEDPCFIVAEQQPACVWQAAESLCWRKDRERRCRRPSIAAGVEIKQSSAPSPWDLSLLLRCWDCVWIAVIQMFLTLGSCILPITHSLTITRILMLPVLCAQSSCHFLERKRRIFFHHKSVFCLLETTDISLRKLPGPALTFPGPAPCVLAFTQMPPWPQYLSAYFLLPVIPSPLPCNLSVLPWWNEKSKDFEVR